LERRDVTAHDEQIRVRGGRTRHLRATHFSFAAACVALIVVAALLRLVFGLYFANPRFAPDNRWYRNAAKNLTTGDGYSLGRLGDPDPMLNHPPKPFAGFPPLFALVLAGLDIAGLESAKQQRTALALISSAGVLLMALLGKRLGGAPVGIVAALIAAAHPLWIQPAGIGMSESVYLVIIPAVLLIALSVLDHPTLWRVSLLGIAVGLATLNRSEAIGLLVVLAVPTLVMASAAWRTRLVLGAALLAGFLLVVSPWLLRNYLMFGGFALSTNLGGSLAGANCPTAYEGAKMGGCDRGCFGRSVVAAYLGTLAAEARNKNPVNLSRELQRVGLAYMAEHKERVPLVMGARILRGWGLFATADQLHYDVVAEGRHRGFQRVGQYLHWVLLPLAIAGAVLLPRQRWRRWSIVLAGPVLFTIASALVFGSVRYRVLAEPSIALLAAAGLVELMKRRRQTGTWA
jgi:4-amino-4-deoxy-L-arabinose transferase-like glycosyltransferase